MTIRIEQQQGIQATNSTVVLEQQQAIAQKLEALGVRVLFPQEPEPISAAEFLARLTRHPDFLTARGLDTQDVWALLDDAVYPENQGQIIDLSHSDWVADRFALNDGVDQNYRRASIATSRGEAFVGDVGTVLPGTHIREAWITGTGVRARSLWGVVVGAIVDTNYFFIPDLIREAASAGQGNTKTFNNEKLQGNKAAERILSSHRLSLQAIFHTPGGEAELRQRLVEQFDRFKEDGAHTEWSGKVSQADWGRFVDGVLQELKKRVDDESHLPESQARFLQELRDLRLPLAVADRLLNSVSLFPYEAGYKSFQWAAYVLAGRDHRALQAEFEQEWQTQGIPTVANPRETFAAARSLALAELGHLSASPGFTETTAFVGLLRSGQLFDQRLTASDRILLLKHYMYSTPLHSVMVADVLQRDAALRQEMLHWLHRNADHISAMSGLISAPLFTQLDPDKQTLLLKRAMALTGDDFQAATEIHRRLKQIPTNNSPIDWIAREPISWPKPDYSET